MAEAVFWYGNAFVSAFNGLIDFTNDTIKIALFTDAAAPDQDDALYANHGLTELATGDGYTTGGETMASKTLAYVDGTNIIKIDAADVIWTFTATRVARYAVIYSDTGVGDPLICFIDFGANKTVTDAGTLTITFSADGIIKTTVTNYA